MSNKTMQQTMQQKSNVSRNNLKTSKRIRLIISTENDYLYIHFNMPSLEKWNPRPAISNYLADVNRRQSFRTVESTKTIQQSYFQHDFESSKDEEEKDEIREKNDWTKISVFDIIFS